MDARNRPPNRGSAAVHTWRKRREGAKSAAGVSGRSGAVPVSRSATHGFLRFFRYAAAFIEAGNPQKTGLSPSLTSQGSQVQSLPRPPSKAADVADVRGFCDSQPIDFSDGGRKLSVVARPGAFRLRTKTSLFTIV